MYKHVRMCIWVFICAYAYIKFVFNVIKPGDISDVCNWCKSGQNLSQEGAFRPWLDPISSEVLPPLESPVDDNATAKSDE